MPRILTLRDRSDAAEPRSPGSDCAKREKTSRCVCEREWRAGYDTTMASTPCCGRFLLLIVFLGPCMAAPAPQDLPVAPNGDPFAPPPNYYPPPPPPTYSYQQPQQFGGPPQPPNNFIPPPNNNYIGPPPPQPMPPQPQYFQPLPPQHGGFQQFSPPAGQSIYQPMPAAAAAAMSGPAYSTGPKEEFEADGSKGGYSGHSHAMPASMDFFGTPQTSLLDAYYKPRQGMYNGYNNYNRQSNDIFGGLLGNSPGGNLLGAFMMNELIF
ncbi:extensin-2 [Aplysia californica]|uniref:Extensin-2 n=1 Tax=Aplysia californica TaxID=6500 RepID=A0ABM0JBI4_APLCA|nr:extensin-2 [Aplysia californica]